MAPMSSEMAPPWATVSTATIQDGAPSKVLYILECFDSLMVAQVKGRARAALRGWSSREQRLPARASAASICAGGCKAKCFSQPADRVRTTPTDSSVLC
jgi:hypothetical protein